MIKMKVSGSFQNSRRFFRSSKTISAKFREIFKKYGERGVLALKESTPKDSGETSANWKYTIEKWGLVFRNSYAEGGSPVAILIQYGHATKNGVYVQGVDYINPTLRPIFNEIAEALKKEVQAL